MNRIDRLEKEQKELVRKFYKLVAEVCYKK